MSSYWEHRNMLERELRKDRERAHLHSLNCNAEIDKRRTLESEASIEREARLAALRLRNMNNNAPDDDEDGRIAYNVNQVVVNAIHGLREQNVNVNAWGDGERMKQIEGTLDERHRECVPEYAEAMESVRGPKEPQQVQGGKSKKNVGQDEKPIARKKSDKNLKALAIIQTIMKDHAFSCDERVHLSEMYTKNYGAERHPGLKLPCIDMRKFQGIMHATFGITNDRVIEGLFRAFDYAGNNIITEPEWIRGLSIFLRGTFEQQLDFVWLVYDINGDNLLSREEMYLFLEDSIVNTKGADDNDTEEAVKDLVEMLFRKLDQNHDGKVDKEDFNKSVRDDHLLLQCCGQCFPSQRHVDVFEATFADEITFKPN